MATVDAVAAIISGGKDWDDFLKATPGEVDLTFADFDQRDLSGRPIERCNFSGAQFGNANLDHTKIKDCCFSGANLTDVSLVEAELCNVTAANLIGLGIVVRKSKWKDVRFENCQLERAQFDDCDITSCHFDGVGGASLSLVNVRCIGVSIRKIQVGRLSLEGVRWRDCDLENWNVDQIEMKSCSAHGGNIRDVGFRAGTVSDTVFAKLRVERLEVHAASRNLDFSESTLVSVDLAGLGLATATMLDTALINCVWPAQEGVISAGGKYVPNSQLLRQPVQDLRGVPPVTRREIADAQYIFRLQEKSTKWFERWGLALWGLTTGFGQSLLRLSVTTFFFLVLGTLLLLAARGQLVGPVFVPTLLYNAWSDAFLEFFALSDAGRSPAGAEGLASGFIRILGFIALGLWVSIGANRLGKLGAE